MEGLDTFGAPAPWSAFRASIYSYGRMTVFNSTHLYYAQISGSDGYVIDNVWVTKYHHGNS